MINIVGLPVDLGDESRVARIGELDHQHFRRAADRLEGVVVSDASCGAANADLGLDRSQVLARYPNLIVARMTPFGDCDPWKDYKGSDLIHLALGGVMMNCGYDPDPSGRYDLPPIAPQAWHAYHIAGEQLAIGILAALIHQATTRQAQEVSCAIHEAVAKNTELDVMNWIMRRAPVYRQTCRHATETVGRVPNISHTKDGRWFMSWGLSARDQAKLAPFLEKFGMAADLAALGARDGAARNVPGSSARNEAEAHALEIIQRFIRSFTYQNVPWREAQAAGLLWAPLRKPHENARDEHWLARGAFSNVQHPDVGRSLPYAVSKWLSSATEWKTGVRAPFCGEHTETVLREWRRPEVPPVPRNDGPPPRRSAWGKPFALQNVRILDFSWFLASAGGTRFAAALGAECVKVEWKDNPDTRLAAMAPIGGRAARAAATAPLPGVDDPDMGGQFNNKNAGKCGLSLNLRHPQGLEIAKRLVAISDVVAEGFSPGVLERLGLGYAVMKQLRPDIVYVQQSGMGAAGLYGRLRTVGPVAASFAGANDMSGLPEPAMPAGWGYSYLDWMGAYGFAQAILGALYHRTRTGEGQHIDASQCEAVIFLNGVAVLDWASNSREWRRNGNRSYGKRAAPHGAYRCCGDDRWIAIACFTEAEWAALLRIAAQDGVAGDPRFLTLEARLDNQDALDAWIACWTEGQDAYECMRRLQEAGVPAGVCQTAADRCDHDPQLAALNWLTEVAGTKIGAWPVAELPMKLSETPAHIGGSINRGAPCYGEDNAYVLGELLGYTSAEIAKFAEKGAI